MKLTWGGVALAIFCAIVLVIEISNNLALGELQPLRNSPILLNTVSELSGAMDIRLQTENNMTLTNTPSNQNGVKMTITTRVQDYPTVDEAWEAHFAAIARWQADDTIQP